MSAELPWSDCELVAQDQRRAVGDGTVLLPCNSTNLLMEIKSAADTGPATRWRPAPPLCDRLVERYGLWWLCTHDAGHTGDCAPDARLLEDAAGPTRHTPRSTP